MKRGMLDAVALTDVAWIDVTVWRLRLLVWRDGWRGRPWLPEICGYGYSTILWWGPLWMEWVQWRWWRAPHG